MVLIETQSSLGRALGQAKVESWSSFGQVLIILYNFFYKLCFELNSKIFVENNNLHFFYYFSPLWATYWQKKLQVSKKKKQAPINKSNLWTNTNGPYGNEKVNHVRRRKKKKSTDKKADSYIDVSWYTVVLLLLDQTYYSIVLYLFKKVFFSIPM